MNVSPPGNGASRTTTSTTPNSRRPTIKSVAQRAGVSTATVSYVLSGRGSRGAGVTPETEARVRNAVAELGYRRNEAARSIRTGTSGYALLSLTMLSDPWALNLIEAATTSLLQVGVTPLVLADSDWRDFVGRQIADVVFIDDLALGGEALAADRELLRQYAKQGQRIVVLSPVLEPEGFDVVRTHGFEGCVAGVTALLQNSQRVACLTNSLELTRDGLRTRYGAYIAALEAAGKPLDPALVVVCERDALSAFEATQTLLHSANQPDAIFAVSDYLAVAAIHSAHTSGLKVPEDLAVMGVGNTASGAKMTPSLSTVGPEQFFETLATHLARRAQEGTRDTGELLDFQWQVIHRATTQTPTKE